jgi:hypothetical protein
VQLVEPAQLGDGPLVIVHAEIDQDVREARVAAVLLDHEQRGGLLAAPVAACVLRGGEALEQPLGEGFSGRGLERVGERVDGLGGDEDVPLRRITGAGAPARPVVALGARERCASAGRVDDAQLAVLAALVRAREALDHPVGREPIAQQREPVRPVARVRVRLRRDGSDLGLGPRDDGADGEELGLYGDAPAARLEVTGGDRVRRDARFSHR